MTNEREIARIEFLGLVDEVFKMKKKLNELIKAYNEHFHFMETRCDEATLSVSEGSPNYKVNELG